MQAAEQTTSKIIITTGAVLPLRHSYADNGQLQINQVSEGRIHFEVKKSLLFRNIYLHLMNI